MDKVKTTETTNDGMSTMSAGDLHAGIAVVLEEFGFVHMANPAGIRSILDELEEARKHAPENAAAQDAASPVQAEMLEQIKSLRQEAGLLSNRLLIGNLTAVRGLEEAEEAFRDETNIREIQRLDDKSILRMALRRAALHLVSHPEWTNELAGRVADAIEACDWSGMPIGNKEILRAAVVMLREGARPSADPRLRIAAETLEELHGLVFGAAAGDEPDVYALDYDDLSALSGRTRRAIACVKAIADFSGEAPSLETEEKLDTAIDVWEEHPDFPVSDWQYQVANGDTRRGYHDWVEAEMEAAEIDHTSGPDM
jgi:hypothetical protein